MAVVKFPDRSFNQLLDRAIDLNDEIQQRCLEEGGEDLWFLFMAVAAADTVKGLHADPVQCVIEFTKSLETLLGPMPVIVGAVTKVKNLSHDMETDQASADITVEGWLMQDGVKSLN